MSISAVFTIVVSAGVAYLGASAISHEFGDNKAATEEGNKERSEGSTAISAARIANYGRRVRTLDDTRAKIQDVRDEQLARRVGTIEAAQRQMQINAEGSTEQGQMQIARRYSALNDAYTAVTSNRNQLLRERVAKYNADLLTYDRDSEKSLLGGEDRPLPAYLFMAPTLVPTTNMTTPTPFHDYFTM